jgi:hypothetical protein
MGDKKSARYFSSIVLIAALFFSLGRSANLPVPDAARHGYEAIQPENMKAILTFLAADELEGREAGHRGLDVAAKFLESQYRLAGLTPAPGQLSMLQQFLIQESKFNPASTIAIHKKEKDQDTVQGFTFLRDFIPMGRITQSCRIEAPVVFAGFGFKNEERGYNDFKGIKPAGKILLLLSGTPQFEAGAKTFTIRPDRFRGARQKAKQARDADAVALLVVMDNAIPREQYLNFWRDHSTVKLLDDPDELPHIYITQTLADSLLRPSGWSVESLKSKIVENQAPHSFEIRMTRLTLDLRIDSQIKTTQNVVAYLEGSDPLLKHEVVAFGAHYDHIGVDSTGDAFNGADDDGSGTTGILEIARAFAANPNRPRRSLLFVSHTAEEKGLLGSRYYTDHPLVPLENTVAQLNVDMIGRNDTNSVYIIGSDFLSRELHEINEAANATIGMQFDYKFNDKEDPNRFYYRSDHYNYARRGIPIIFYFSGVHEDYHKPSDTVDKINFEKMAKVARLIYLTGWYIADREARLKIDGPAAAEEPE